MPPKKQGKTSTEKSKPFPQEQKPKHKPNAQNHPPSQTKKKKFNPNMMFDGPVDMKIYGAPANMIFEVDETTITQAKLHPGSYSHIQAISDIMHIPPKKRNQFSRNFNQNHKKILQSLELLEANPTAFGKGELNPLTGIQQHDYGPTIKMGRFPVDLRENYTFPQNKDKKMSNDKKKRKEKEAKKREQQLNEDPQNYVGKQQQRYQKHLEKLQAQLKPHQPKQSQPAGKNNQQAEKNKQGGQQNRQNAPDSNKGKQGKKHKETREKIFVPFEEYWSLEQVEKGLEARKLFRGTLVINQFSMMRSFIKSADFSCKVMFKDGTGRNRASDGAQVIFEVLEGDYEKFLVTKNPTTSTSEPKAHIIEAPIETEDELEEVEEEDMLNAKIDVEEENDDEEEEEETKGEIQPPQKTQKEVVENDSDYETVDEDEEDEEEEIEITYKKNGNRKGKADNKGKKISGPLPKKSKQTFADREEYFHDSESDEELSNNMDVFVNMMSKGKRMPLYDESDESDEFDEEEEKKIDKVLEKSAKKLGIQIGDIDDDEEDEDDDDEEPFIDDSVSDSDEELDEEDEYEIQKAMEYFSKSQKIHQNNKGKGGKNAHKQPEFKPKQQKNLPPKKAAKNPPAKSKAPTEKFNKGRVDAAKRERQPKNFLFAKVVYIEYDPLTTEFSACVDTAYFNRGVVLAQPIDKRLPTFKVINSLEDMAVPEVGKKYYFTAKFVDWPSDSNLPYAELTRLIGLSGNIDIECDALLLNYNVLNEEFTAQTYDYLKQYEEQLDPLTREFIIPQAEREKRWDLTNEIILTCDPVTARDLDDALSIKKFAEGIYELGVHIADVSHFVKEGTPLDQDARLRTTSVYLPHMVIPMLPRLLCENLCSLNPGVERLAFSIYLYITEDGVVLDKDKYAPRIGKSIIKTVGKLNYDQVQDVITGKITTANELPIVYVPKGVDKEQVIKDILLMNRIAQKIRTRRFETGSIYFEKDKNYFKLDSENYPQSYKKEQRKESNFMVEEYMLLANQYIGKFIVNSCKEIALLRCHPAPRQARTNHVEGFLKKMGLEINFGSSKDLQDSINSIFKDPNVKDEYKSILKLKMIRLMEAARYFVVEYDQDPVEWRHYALNFDVYTHFTSPIRRYPDVFVHRLAEKCLQFKNDVGKYVDRLDMLALMNKCNDCKMNARKVSDGADLIFSCLWLKYNKKESTGVVLELGKNFATVYIPEFEVEKKILFSDLKSFVRVKKFNPSEKLFEIELEFHPPGKKAVSLTLKEYNRYDFFISAKEDFPIEIKVEFLHSDQNQKILLC